MSYKNIEIKKLENSEIEISGEILSSALDKQKKEALKNISQNTEIKGFRKGKIPEDVLKKHVGEMAILQEAAELALTEEYPNILLEHKINPIGHPEISLTKLAPNENLGFKAKVAVMPEVTLPDYKKIASQVNSEKDAPLEVSDEDLNKTIETIQKQRADKDGKLPEINDEFVKSLGDFKNVDDFKEKIRENMKLEKARVAKDQKRGKIADGIIEKSDISMPRLLIEGELNRMIGQFKSDIEQSGLTYEKYLEQVKKTDEDVRKEWQPIAEKKAKLQLVLNKIALEEKISPEEDQVKKEMEHILSHHKDAPEERVRVFVETMLMNEKVFDFLEKQK